MIEKTIDAWHQLISGQVPADRFEAALDDLLADEVIFYSPVVYTPQRGRDLTKMYLMAAGSTFNPSNGEGGGAKSGSATSCFRYTKKILSGNQAAPRSRQRTRAAKSSRSVTRSRPFTPATPGCVFSRSSSRSTATSGRTSSCSTTAGAIRRTRRCDRKHWLGG